MAQPPLSQQLKLMEEELGVILFERKGRMMELTQAGRSFYDYAVTLTKYMEEALMEMQSFRHGIRGKLSIGINTISDRLIPQALQQFRTTHPQVTYKIQQNESAQLCRLLDDGKVELACVRMPVQTERYEVLHLPQEPLFYISSTPLDSPTEMTPGAEMRTYFKQLTGIPLLLPSTEGLGMFELILDKFREHQVTPPSWVSAQTLICCWSWSDSASPVLSCLTRYYSYITSTHFTYIAFRISIPRLVRHWSGCRTAICPSLHNTLCNWSRVCFPWCKRL